MSGSEASVHSPSSSPSSLDSESVSSSVSSSPKRSGKQPLACHYDGCGKIFKQYTDLQNHIRTHTGEKPYHCEFVPCGKRFATNSQLRRHERTHTKERPCACRHTHCGKRFRTASHLKRHLKTHDTDALQLLVAASTSPLAQLDGFPSLPGMVNLGPAPQTPTYQLPFPMMQSTHQENTLFSVRGILEGEVNRSSVIGLPPTQMLLRSLIHMARVR